MLSKKPYIPSITGWEGGGRGEDRPPPEATSKGSEAGTDRLQTLVHGQNGIQEGRGRGGDPLSPECSHKGGGQGGDRPHPASPRALAKPVAGHANVSPTRPLSAHEPTRAPPPLQRQRRSLAHEHNGMREGGSRGGDRLPPRRTTGPFYPTAALSLESPDEKEKEEGTSEASPRAQRDAGRIGPRQRSASSKG